MVNTGQIGVGSIYGDAPTTTQNFIKKMKKNAIFDENGKKIDKKTLIVDCRDGQILRSFVYGKFNVIGYEPNLNYLNGGIFKIQYKDQIIDKKIIGLKNILKEYNNVKLINDNFYETKINDKYDFIYVNKSLDRLYNSKFTMKEKINKLLSVLNKDGYLYIYYYLAIDEKDYIKYPSNQYLRKNEILKYINKKIVNIGEGYIVNSKPHYKRLYDHKHKIGYILIQNKKKIKENKPSNYRIIMGTDI